MPVAEYGACIHLGYPSFGCNQHTPIVLAASRTNRVDLRTWSHTICDTNDTNRAFRKVEITCILVDCTSLGIMMTRSLSGVRVRPLQRSTVENLAVFILWMGRGSSRRFIAHIIHT